MITGEQVVAQARTWLGTAFYHQGRSKKTPTAPGAVDCIGLVIGVIDELKIRDKSGQYLLSDFDENNYSPLPSGQRLVSTLDEHLIRVSTSEMMPGDILLFSIYDNPQHVGFLSDYFAGGNGLIHCWQGSDKVVENYLSGQWLQRLVQPYRFYPESMGTA